MFKFIRNRRNNTEDDDDTNASDDVPGRGSGRRGRVGGAAGQWQPQQQLRQSRSLSNDVSTKKTTLLRRTNSGGGMNNFGNDKAYHRGGNRSWMSDTSCSETDGTDTWTTAASSFHQVEGGHAVSVEWSDEDGSGGGGDKASIPPTPPPPPPPTMSRRVGGTTAARSTVPSSWAPPRQVSSTGVDSVSSGLSRGSGSGGEEGKDKRRGQGRMKAKTTKIFGDAPSPGGVVVGTPTDKNPAARVGGSAGVSPHPPVGNEADDGDGGRGEEKSMKIKPPSIRGMPQPRKSKGLSKSDPALVTSSSPSPGSSVAEVAAMQQLAQLVVGLRVELRASNAAREELEAKLLEESRKKEQAAARVKRVSSSSDDEDDGAARRRLEGENTDLRADVDALFAEQDDLRGEVVELGEEKKMLNDVIARLKREGGEGGGASASHGSHGPLKKTTSSSLQDLEVRVWDLTDENHKLESELQLLVEETVQLISSRGLEAEQLQKSLEVQESRHAEALAEKDRIIKDIQEKIDSLRAECDGLEKAAAENKISVAVLEDELDRHDEQLERNEAKTKEEVQLLQDWLTQADKEMKTMQERSSVTDRLMLGQKKTIEELLKERNILRQELDDIKEELKVKSSMSLDERGNLLNLQTHYVSLDEPKRELKKELDSKNVVDLETTLQSKRDLLNMISSLEEMTVELEAEVNEANGTISMLEDDLDRKDAQVKEMMNNLTILLQKISKAEQSNAALSHENDELNTSIKVMTIENKAAKDDFEMWKSMKNIDDDLEQEDVYQEVKELVRQVEELQSRNIYKKVMELEEEVYRLHENEQKMQHDLDESYHALTILREALKDLEDALTVRNSEIRTLKASSLDEKEVYLKTIKSAQKEHQYELQSSTETIATLKIKVASLETKMGDLEEELNAHSITFLALNDEKNATVAMVTDLEEKLMKATDENGTLTKRISELIMANEKMKEEVKNLGECLTTGSRRSAFAVVASSSRPSTPSFPSCAASSDPMASCDALISELRNKIKEIVSSRNAALEEVAILRSDASVAPHKAIEPPSGPDAGNQTAKQNSITSTNTTSVASAQTFPQGQSPSPIMTPNESIKFDEEDESSTKTCEKTAAYSRSPSNSGSRGSSLLEAAKKLCSKLDEKRSKEEPSKFINRSISVPALSAAPRKAEHKAAAPSEEEQVKHIVDQDDEEVSAKEIKEDSHMETAGTSDVKARSSLSSPEKEKQAKSKSKSVTDQVTSVYFEKCGMSKMSDMSWSSDSSRLKRPSDTVAKKVKICRNGVFMGTYEGDLNAEGQRHGFGVLLCDNGNSYEGEWKKDKRDGLGVARYSSGDVYDGQWHRGRRQGHGIMYIEAGDTYIGSWYNGLKHGAGTYHWADGEVDVSWYQEDKRSGEGVRWNANRLKAFRLIRGTKKEELSLDEAYTTSERLGLSLEKSELCVT